MSDFNETVYYRKPGNGHVAELLFHGRLTLKDVHLIEELIRIHKISNTSLTSDGNIRILYLKKETLEQVLESCNEFQIAVRGGYQRVPLKVYTAALSGLRPGEELDVRPYADLARQIDVAEQLSSLPKHYRFRVYFAGLETDLAEASDCNLIFLANGSEAFRVLIRQEDGSLFELTEKMICGRFLSYIKIALRLSVKTLSADDYIPAFWKEMQNLTEEERSCISVPQTPVTKQGKGDFTCGPFIMDQKQKDLYTTKAHPYGGIIPIVFWKRLNMVTSEMEDVELRIDRSMNLYFCNLLADEAHAPLTALPETAYTDYETSRASDRCSICHGGQIDPQLFVSTMLKELKKLRLKNSVLPTFTISGCGRCCFNIPKETLVFVNQPSKNIGDETLLSVSAHLHMDEKDITLGILPQKNILPFLMAIGSLVQSADSDFYSWYHADPELINKIVGLYQ